jgi:diamine N-acetyltransferase
MYRIRDIEDIDRKVIESWPPYPPEFKAQDYALRKNGWIEEYAAKPDTRCLAVERGGDLVAFTILSKTGPAEAEFRIALRADEIGTGTGSAAAALTLSEGFRRMSLSRIHLIVRKANKRAERLYTRLGFTHCGELQKDVNGETVDFYTMEIWGMNFAPS